MGMIKTQATQSAIFNYVGVLLGFVNTTVLLPNLISQEKIGLLSFLNSATIIFSTICALGVPLITVKVFPKFRNEQGGHNGFFAFSFLMTLMGGVLGILSYVLLEDQLINAKNEARFFAPFAIGFMVLFVFRLVFKNFDTFIRMLYNSVLGAITENMLAKLILTLALFAFWFVEGYPFVYLFWLYILGLSIPGLTAIAHILIKKSYSFDFALFKQNSAGMGKELRQLGLYGLLGSMGTIIVLEVDRVMISNMLGLAQNGIYTIVFFFGIFVSIPSKSLKRVAIVVVSDAWKNNDIPTIKSVYSKSCLHQYLFAVYLFLGVWLNVDFVLQLIPPEYTAGKYVILYIGIGQIVDMLAGVNTEIISTSRFFRYNTFFVAALILLVIVLNYVFIPLLGIDGAAIASALAVVLVNVARFIFLYQKLDYQPIGRWFLIISGLGLLCYFVVNALPVLDSFYINILLRGSALTLLYWIPAYFLRLSPDINDSISQFLKKF